MATGYRSEWYHVRKSKSLTGSFRSHLGAATDRQLTMLPHRRKGKHTDRGAAPQPEKPKRELHLDASASWNNSVAAQAAAGNLQTLNVAQFAAARLKEMRELEKAVSARSGGGTP